MPLLPRPVAVGIVVVIMTVWVVDFGAQFLPGSTHQSSPAIHGIVLTVVGGVLLVGRNKSGGDPPGGPGSEGGGDPQ